MKALVGGMSELAFMSTRALPGVLTRNEFTYRHPDVRSALPAALSSVLPTSA